MYFDRFDICEAWYLYLCHYHGGMACPLYRRLSRLSEYFTPGTFLEVDTLTENGRAIYDSLTEGSV